MLNLQPTKREKQRVFNTIWVFILLMDQNARNFLVKLPKFLKPLHQTLLSKKWWQGCRKKLEMTRLFLRLSGGVDSMATVLLHQTIGKSIVFFL
jgi:hypothetical protein